MRGIKAGDKVVTIKNKICPLVAGVKCTVVEVGSYEVLHEHWEGDSILRYDLIVKDDSGMIFEANKEWFGY